MRYFKYKSGNACQPGSNAADEGRGAEQAGPAPALHLQLQYSKGRHAVTMPLKLHAS